MSFKSMPRDKTLLKHEVIVPVKFTDVFEEIVGKYIKLNPYKVGPREENKLLNWLFTVGIARIRFNDARVEEFFRFTRHELITKCPPGTSLIGYEVVISKDREIPFENLLPILNRPVLKRLLYSISVFSKFDKTKYPEINAIVTRLTNLSRAFILMYHVAPKQEKKFIEQYYKKPVQDFDFGVDLKAAADSFRPKKAAKKPKPTVEVRIQKSTVRWLGFGLLSALFAIMFGLVTISGLNALMKSSKTLEERQANERALEESRQKLIDEQKPPVKNTVQQTENLEQRWFTKIRATCIGKWGVNVYSSYGFNTAKAYFVALPAAGQFGKWVEIKTGYGSAIVPVGDVGPWNGAGDVSKEGDKYDDPYWKTAEGKPHVVQNKYYQDKRGRYSNGAGIDLSYRLWKELGISLTVGIVVLDWRFVDPPADKQAKLTK